MDPFTIATGIIALLKPVLAYIREKTAAGEYDATRQAALWQQIDDIRSGKAFESDAWKQD
jgi:hypothetical protein